MRRDFLFYLRKYSPPIPTYAFPMRMRKQPADTKQKATTSPTHTARPTYPYSSAFLFQRALCVDVFLGIVLAIHIASVKRT